MKELTKMYGDLLQDKRVRAEQSKYESITRQRNTVMARYKKVYEAFHGLLSGISQAQAFYKEMSETVDSLNKNVETFINNRRSEGAQLLSQMEREKGNGASEQEDREREKLRQLMDRLSTEPKTSPTPSSAASSKARSPPTVPTATYPGAPVSPPNLSSHFATPAPPVQQQQHGVPLSHSPAPYGQFMPPGAAGGMHYVSGQPFQQGAAAPLTESYNPMAYPYQTPVSPPPSQQFYSSTPTSYGGYTGPAPSATPSQFMHQPYVPPPPPPRPQDTTYPQSTGPFPSGPGGYAHARPYQHHRTKSQSQGQGPPAPSDPWAGLNAWK